jgi:hypothetical protein
VLVRSLLTDTAVNRTFELFVEAGPASTDWSSIFGALTPDPAGGREEPPAVQSDLARLAR